MLNLALIYFITFYILLKIDKENLNFNYLNYDNNKLSLL